jgi:hypothetical protein
LRGPALAQDSLVDFTYELPFAFTGTIEKVTVELK